MDPAELTGILFDIQGFSVHDGPGCRTLVFFKGCPLSCCWCSNPVGKNPFPESLFHRQKCTLDRLCVEACPHQAITVESENLIIDRAKYVFCTTFDCASACCTGALQKGGYTMKVRELYHLIQRDSQYWGNRGGITLTGGEPFFQPGFASAILKRCHDSYVHTAVQTNRFLKMPNGWPVSYIGRKEINLLPLYHLGREKYALTGHSYYAEVLDIPSKESILGIKEILELKGIASYIGSDTPF
ncbi:MAG: glycyl-radical enzyme activating protein [Bacteroidia bacterium]|nr:glycyl-radical enzyme activating protein [Bacteroidia bacterium]